MKQPVVENTTVMPVAKLDGVGHVAAAKLLAATGTQYFGVTAPSPGALVASNTSMNPALAPEVVEADSSDPGVALRT